MTKIVFFDIDLEENNELYTMDILSVNIEGSLIFIENIDGLIYRTDAIKVVA